VAATTASSESDAAAGDRKTRPAILTMMMLLRSTTGRPSEIRGCHRLMSTALYVEHVPGRCSRDEGCRCRLRWRRQRVDVVLFNSERQDRAQKLHQMEWWMLAGRGTRFVCVLSPSPLCCHQEPFELTFCVFSFDCFL